MKKVELSLNENLKYDVIKKLVDTNGNKNRAANKLGCTVRSINRMIKGYREFGKEFFVHGNKNRKPAHSFTDSFKDSIAELYINNYYDYNITHFVEALGDFEGINISISSARNILRERQIISPKAHRATKKAIKKELKAVLTEAKTKGEKIPIQKSIALAEFPHPRRPRCAYFGELIQMDASIHKWFNNEYSSLHLAVDDNTGTIVGAWFDRAETLNGYYNVFYQILTKYGIPYCFLTDNRTVFDYHRKDSENIENNTLTQFGYACKQLGVEIRTSSIAQTKGRVERMFNTLQSRLVAEFRTNGITSIDEANKFLESYLLKFNKKFALPIDYNKSVFEKQPSKQNINLILAVIKQRKTDNGHCFKYENNYYIPINRNGEEQCYPKGTVGTIIKAFDGSLYCCIDEKIYALKLIPERKSKSENFDKIQLENIPTKVYIPSKNHPWRSSEFYKYLCSEQVSWERIYNKLVACS